MYINYINEILISVILTENKDFKWLKVGFQVITVTTNPLVSLIDDKYKYTKSDHFQTKVNLRLFKILIL